jgi:NTP pyrophosphatase (non-canonical NTP hydrolase)
MTDRLISRRDMVLREMIAQCRRDSEQWFPHSQTLPMLTLCMVGEAGEVANLVKKVARGTHNISDLSDMIAEEVIDVLVYLCNIMGHPDLKGVDWQQIWTRKRAFNAVRFGPRADVGLEH